MCFSPFLIKNKNVSNNNDQINKSINEAVHWGFDSRTPSRITDIQVVSHLMYGIKRNKVQNKSPNSHGISEIA